jgi:hypothetical protein
VSIVPGASVCQPRILTSFHDVMYHTPFSTCTRFLVGQPPLWDLHKRESQNQLLAGKGHEKMAGAPNVANRARKISMIAFFLRKFITRKNQYDGPKPFHRAITPMLLSITGTTITTKTICHTHGHFANRVTFITPHH